MCIDCVRLLYHQVPGHGIYDTHLDRTCPFRSAISCCVFYSASSGLDECHFLAMKFSVDVRTSFSVLVMVEAFMELT